MSGVCVCGVSHVQAHPGPAAAQAGGNPGAGRNRMFCPHLLVGLAAALEVYKAPKNGLLE